MKILYFYQYFTTPKGAWGTRAYEFARRWTTAGHQVIVVTSVYDKSDVKAQGFLSSYEVDGIEVKVVNVPLSNKHGKLLRLSTFLAYAGVASYYAVVLPVDVILASSGPLTVGIPGLVSKFIRRRPFVFEVRDLFSEGLEQLDFIKSKSFLKAIRSFESACYRFSDVVIPLSSSMSDWIKRDYNPKELFVIPNASDNALFSKGKLQPKPKEFKKGKKAFVFTGTIGAANDCGQLIAAATELKKRKDEVIDIFLIGDGKEKNTLQKKAEELELSNIHFIGLMPKEELVTWIAHSQAALLILKDIPVFETVSPNKLFDSFAAGVPIIQTTQGWIKDILEEHQCGLTVNHNEEHSLVEHLLTLAYDDKLCKKMAKNAEKVGKTIYDRDLLSEQYLEILAKVIQA